ncbi:hypothetical protein STIAU_0116, partial [Stigmatella aurantiaca DW4/3-1]
MLLTRAAASPEVTPMRERVRVHAVLGVEGGDVVMQGDREAVGGRMLQERAQLRRIEIMGERERVQPQPQQVRGRQRIGDVEREVPVQHRAGLTLGTLQEVHHRAPVAHQHRIRAQPADALVIALLARLLHPHRGDRHPQARRPGPLHRALKAHHLHPIQLHLGQPRGDDGLELRLLAAQGNEPRRALTGGLGHAPGQRGAHLLQHRRLHHRPARAPLHGGRQLRHELAADRLELGDGQVQPTSQPSALQERQPEGSSSEGAQLVPQQPLVQPAASRRGQWHRAAGGRIMPPGPGPNLEGSPLHARDAQLQRNPALGLARGEQPLDTAGQRGIAVEPHPLSGSHPSQIRTRLAKTQHPTVPPPFHPEDGASWLVLVLWRPRIEDDAHARARLRGLRRGLSLQRRGHLAHGRLGAVRLQPQPPRPRALVRHDLDFLARNGLHPAQVQPPVLRKAALHQRLVVRAREKAMGEAAAVRQRHAGQILRELGLVGSARQDALHPAPVPLHRGGDVRRALQAAFDLQAVDADVHELRHGPHPREILGAEQVLHLAEFPRLPIDDQVIRQAARLGALPSVRRAPSPGLAGQALAAPGHAERAVDEDLQLDLRLPSQPADLRRGQFAGDDGAAEPQPLGEPHPFRAGERHLRGGMQLELGADRPGQQGHRRILHDECIHPGRGRPPDQVLDEGQLGLEHQGIQGKIGPGTRPVDEGERLGKAGQGEIIGASTCIESFIEPEVDGIRATGEGGPEGLKIPRGGEDFRTSQRHDFLLNTPPPAHTPPWAPRQNLCPYPRPAPRLFMLPPGP